jgi:2-keto-4-pentenoate hydratase
MADHAELIAALYEGRKNGAAPVGVDHVQLEVQEALAVQLGVLARFQTAGEHVGGWKVGLTSGAARDRMGKDFRPFGYVLKSRILRTGAKVPRQPIMKCSVEPELCLIVGSPLRGNNVDATAAKAAVRAVAPAFEINERRTNPEHGNALLLADGLAQWGIVVGPEAPVRDGLIDTTVEFYAGDKLVETKTPGATMDDPYLSLARVARLLHKFGLGLEPGQPVITGSFYNHVVTQPAAYRARFVGIGDVSVEFI